MYKIIVAILALTFLTAQVPYSKQRYVDGKTCAYHFSGKQQGGEDLIGVQCS